MPLATANYISPALQKRMEENPTPVMRDLKDVEKMRLHADCICSRMKSERLDNSSRPCAFCYLFSGENEPCVRVLVANQYFKLIQRAEAELASEEEDL